MPGCGEVVLGKAMIPVLAAVAGPAGPAGPAGLAAQDGRAERDGRGPAPPALVAPPEYLCVACARAHVVVPSGEGGVGTEPPEG